MNLIFFDGAERDHLLPLTFTRPVAHCRIGIITIAEKWEKRLEVKGSYLTQDYLAEKYKITYTDDNLYLNGSVCPTETLVEAVLNLEMGAVLVKDEVLIAARLSEQIDSYAKIPIKEAIQFNGEFTYVDRPWKIFKENAAELELDFELLTAGRKSQEISETNTLIGDRIFLEEGAKVEASILNSTSGPIYLGKDAEIMEGSMVRGGLALGAHSVLKLGAKIYGAATFGPHVKVGGEVNNSVIFGYSNKGHDGFLGNSVLGEWCNIGADSNNSNLKNNYDEVRLWSYVKEGFEKTGLQFCGLIMGDHSKCGINTMFNTGTVIGVSCNIYGSGFPRNFVPSFSWGGAAGFTTYNLKKALATAERVMSRRDIPLDETETAILSHIYEGSQGDK